MIVSRFNDIKDLEVKKESLESIFKKDIAGFPDIEVLNIIKQIKIYLKLMQDATTEEEIKEYKKLWMKEKCKLSNFCLCDFKNGKRGGKLEGNIKEVYGIQIDIDNYKLEYNEREILKKKLSENAYCVYDSPSGGLKSIFKYDVALTDYRQSEAIWHLVAAEIEEYTGQQVDQHTWDAAKCCFIAQDNGGILNPDNCLVSADYIARIQTPLEPFKPVKTKTKTTKKSKNAYVSNSTIPKNGGNPWARYERDIQHEPKFRKLSKYAIYVYPDLQLYLHLSGKNDGRKDGEMEIGATTLAKNLCMTRDKVSKGINELITAGFIERIRLGTTLKDGTKIVSKYKLSNKWKTIP